MEETGHRWAGSIAVNETGVCQRKGCTNEARTMYCCSSCKVMAKAIRDLEAAGHVFVERGALEAAVVIETLNRAGDISKRQRKEHRKRTSIPSAERDRLREIERAAREVWRYREVDISPELAALGEVLNG